MLDQPCLDFCNGGCCTAQGQCIPFDDQVQEDTCGTTTCAPCAGDLSCIAGTCTEDPVWEITIRNLIIAPLDPDGDEWDGFFSTTGPEPDPYVKSGLDDPAIGFFPQGLTDRITDTHTPNWTAATQRTYSHLESTLVEKGLKFQIRDYDGALPPAEQVGNCTSPISMADLSAGTKTIATCGESVTNLRIDFALQ